MPTWDAGQYLRFATQRTQPCRDLAARVRVAAPGRVVDLGCGPGNSTAVLRERWPGAAISGLDDSAEMIAAARKGDPSIEWVTGDISGWAAAGGDSYDVVFSNAALQWVPDHETLLPRLMGRVSPGGALAFQVPGNLDAPAHEAMRALARSDAWRKFFVTSVREWHVLTLDEYYDVLSGCATTVELWHTEYIHVMPDAASIVDWYKGTGLRPFLDALPADRREAFTADYLHEIERAYPARADGRVLFPFRRYFLMASR